jgi:hypothetical protein
VTSDADFLAIAIVRNISFPSSLKQTTTIANEAVSSVSTPSRNRPPLMPKTDGIQQQSPGQSVNKTTFRNRIIATPAKIDGEVDVIPETSGEHRTVDDSDEGTPEISGSNILSKGKEPPVVDGSDEGMYLFHITKI